MNHDFCGTHPEKILLTAKTQGDEHFYKISLETLYKYIKTRYSGDIDREQPELSELDTVQDKILARVNRLHPDLRHELLAALQERYCSACGRKLNYSHTSCR